MSAFGDDINGARTQAHRFLRALYSRAPRKQCHFATGANALALIGALPVPGLMLILPHLLAFMDTPAVWGPLVPRAPSRAESSKARDAVHEDEADGNQCLIMQLSTLVETVGRRLGLELSASLLVPRVAQLLEVCQHSERR